MSAAFIFVKFFSLNRQLKSSESPPDLVVLQCLCVDVQISGLCSRHFGVGCDRRGGLEGGTDVDHLIRDGHFHRAILQKIRFSLRYCLRILVFSVVLFCFPR